ncbi:MAG: hypothetical protein A2267_07365 [Omnitrophica WOR_2 bacterium RIFOXYA12_FULL_38_10]|nr:MAG: hypothetical protein A2267_07365 [Omnitrophica WOR_2 bacterium RIFOXYA12_FULL_38_10]
MNRTWFKVSDVENMTSKEKITLMEDYVNPGMIKLLKILRFDTPCSVSAEGVYITLNDGRKILDMTGGSCVLGLGHNHPRILEVRRKFAENKRMEVCKALVSPYMAALAANMASLLPGDLQYSYFCGSGAEAIESALKLAQKYGGKNRLGLAYTDRSFHGKSYGSMSVSSMEEHRHNFQLLDKCYQVPYGDSDALEELFRSKSIENNKPDICAFVLEAIHGTRIIFPPEGYLKKVRELCTKYDVLLIMDEIYIGFGRTGYWFAFEADNIVPDIVCYSKSFGGGKASIAGITARKPVFLQAYGKSGDSMIHSSTFSGMGEECATAIEAVNIIKDENLVERARELGAYLEMRLKELKEKHPKRILDVRGRGLLWGVELEPAANQIEPIIKRFFPDKLSSLLALTGAIVLSELFHAHNILSYLGFTRRNLIVFSPPYIIKKEELDQAVNALDKILSTSWLILTQRFVAR